MASTIHSITRPIETGLVSQTITNLLNLHSTLKLGQSFFNNNNQSNPKNHNTNNVQTNKSVYL